MLSISGWLLSDPLLNCKEEKPSGERGESPFFMQCCDLVSDLSDCRWTN